ncbi:MAG TPA: hypothetical protein VMU16_06025 [Candidatus Binataceae bacterium]|nr:hypothetical protein [Candidatus Binataceae bacterium]
MKKIIGAAILFAVCMSGVARAECPANLKGQDVNLSGTVTDHLRNPHYLTMTGQWSLGVEIPDGPCAGHVVVRTDEKPVCYAGQKVSLSGKVVSKTFFGSSTAIEGDHNIMCSNSVVSHAKKP